jgi:alkanesulfonate monooxygenase SsuD/methylene tetrahydromethanopterin reductase-like flavin-dependent oxidoreductase (luciferase family)
MTANGMNKSIRWGLIANTLMQAEPCDMDRLRGIATLGDNYDFETLWVPDHLIFHTPILDATAAVSILGALTHRVNVGTNILQLPLRRAVDVAKAYSTISYLTGGRVILGVGVGGEFDAEWRAAGVDPRTRGKRCDEAIEALKWYWDGSTESGEYFESPGIAIAPGPVGGRVPIWIGGRKAAAVSRAARCDGSINMWVTAERCAEIRRDIIDIRGSDDDFTFGVVLPTRIADNRKVALEEISDALSSMTFDPRDREDYMAFGSANDISDDIGRYMEAGIQHVAFYVPGTNWTEQVTRLATEVFPLFT